MNKKGGIMSEIKKSVSKLKLKCVFWIIPIIHKCKNSHPMDLGFIKSPLFLSFVSADQHSVAPSESHVLTLLSCRRKKKSASGVSVQSRSFLRLSHIPALSHHIHTGIPQTTLKGDHCPVEKYKWRGQRQSSSASAADFYTQNHTHTGLDYLQITTPGL